MSAIPESDSQWASLISETKDKLPPVEQLVSAYPEPDPASVAKTIDHTQLSLSATEDQIDKLCNEAREFQFATVCVRLNYVSRAVKNLQGTSVGVACVIGFHEGTYSTDEKVAETKKAVEDGASELDMVMNYPWLKEKRYVNVYEDISAVRKAAGSAENVTLKVILETSQLSRDEIIAGCVVSSLAKADFVKTSTGFNGAGANVENVGTMRGVVETINKEVKVKASGGVRTADDCIKMIRAGASRIGASAGIKIVQGVLGEEKDAAPTSKADGY